MNKSRKAHRRTQSTSETDFGKVLGIPKSKIEEKRHLSSEKKVFSPSLTLKAIEQSSNSIKQKQVIVDVIEPSIPKSNSGNLVFGKRKNLSLSGMHLNGSIDNKENICDNLGRGIFVIPETNEVMQSIEFSEKSRKQLTSIRDSKSSNDLIVAFKEKFSPEKKKPKMPLQELNNQKSMKDSKSSKDSKEKLLKSSKSGSSIAKGKVSSFLPDSLIDRIRRIASRNDEMKQKKVPKASGSKKHTEGTNKSSFEGEQKPKKRDRSISNNPARRNSFHHDTSTINVVHDNCEKAIKSHRLDSKSQAQLETYESKLKLFSHEMTGLRSRITGLEKENNKLSGQVSFLLQEKNTLWNASLNNQSKIREIYDVLKTTEANVQGIKRKLEGKPGRSISHFDSSNVKLMNTTDTSADTSPINKRKGELSFFSQYLQAKKNPRRMLFMPNNP